MFDIIKCTGQSWKPATIAVLTLFAMSLATAQTPATLGSGASEPNADEWTALSAADLEELIGPIALYPDDLIAIVLPASTYPLQIVQASRYLKDREANPELKPDPAWDDSVVALLNYPEALALLNDDLDWTWQLGEAVVYQQGDVLNAIQSFRDRAYAAGNLATDDHQQVTTEDDGAITIAPTDPEVIYVPYYDPARVVVRGYAPAYFYYPYAYPLYYYPYPAGYSFGSGFFWGVTSAFLIGWHDHYLHVLHPSYFGHPYYGYNYYTPWYSRTSIYVNVNNYGGHHYWRPGYRGGVRPRHPVSIGGRYDATFAASSRQRIRTTRIGNRRDGTTGGYTRDYTDRRVVDNGSVRRLRGGRVDGTESSSARSNDNSARRPRSGRVDAGNTRNTPASTGSSRQRSLGNAYQRPRNSDGRATRDVDNAAAARGRNGTIASNSRFATSRSANNNRLGRMTGRPSPATTQTRSSPTTFGRVAPTRRAPTNSRPAQGREQPMSRPGARSTPASRSNGIGRAAGGAARQASSSGRVMQRQAASGGRTVQRQASSGGRAVQRQASSGNRGGGASRMAGRGARHTK